MRVRPPTAASAAAVVPMYRALGKGQSLRVLAVMSDAEQTCAEVATALRIPMATVVRYLQVLRRAGLVVAVRHQHRYGYRLAVQSGEERRLHLAALARALEILSGK